MRFTALGVVVAALVPVPALAQNFNIDFGAQAGTPASTYAAAGLPGVWNTLPGAQGTQYPLVDIHGAATLVLVRNLGGTALIHANDLATSGNDQALMDEYLVTFSTAVETCLFFTNLENGVYEVITYAWTPTMPGITSEVRVDDADQPPELVGGLWPGGHAEGVTYAVHTVEVVNGTLNMHSVRLAFGNDRAALNGVQLRRLVACPGDANGNGMYDVGDLGVLLSDFGGTGGPFGGDIDGDGDVDVSDLGLLLTVFGTPCA